MGIAAAEVERRLGRLRAACRRAGVKVTHQRLEIYRALASSEEHPDAEAVLRAVQPRAPTVSLDTVYRALGLFAELGVAAPLGPRRESVRFDANPARHHHHVCLRCGRTRDFESPEFDALRPPPSVHGLGTVQALQVELRGCCAGCAGRERAAGRPEGSRHGRSKGRAT